MTMVHIVIGGDNLVDPFAETGTRGTEGLEHSARRRRRRGERGLSRVVLGEGKASGQMEGRRGEHEDIGTRVPDHIV